MSSDPASEGFLSFGEWRTCVTPLVVVHGGPGCSHDYLVNVAAVGESGRPVIHYDQLGGGRSTLLPDKGADFWTVALFLAELDNLLDALKIADGYHLLGQSWGGMLGAEHAILRPRGLKGLILSNSPASMELWVSEAKRLRAELPREIEDALDRHEDHQRPRVPRRHAGVLRRARVPGSSHSSRVVEDHGIHGAGLDGIQHHERPE